MAEIGSSRCEVVIYSRVYASVREIKLYKAPKSPSRNKIGAAAKWNNRIEFGLRLFANGDLRHVGRTTEPNLDWDCSSTETYSALVEQRD